MGKGSSMQPEIDTAVLTLHTVSSARLRLEHFECRYMQSRMGSGTCWLEFRPTCRTLYLNVVAACIFQRLPTTND